MSPQITGPVPQPTMGDQMAAFQALAGLAEMFGHLPIPYVTVHMAVDAHFDLQFTTPDDFEQWRTALQIAPDAVELHLGRQDSWLAAKGVFRGVPLKVSGHNVPLTEAVAGQDRVAA